jgi:hypothetical protein
MNALYMSRNSGPDITGQEKKSANGDLIPHRSSDLAQKASGVHQVLEALFEGYSDSVKLMFCLHIVSRLAVPSCPPHAFVAWC